MRQLTLQKGYASSTQTCPLVRNENGLQWSNEAEKRLDFCLKVTPQLPLLAIARFIYADASDTTVKRISEKLYQMKKRSAKSAGGGLKKRKKDSGANEEESVDDEDDADNNDEESVDDDDDDESDGVVTGFTCCNCERDPKHIDDEWSYLGDDGYLYIADDKDEDVIAHKDSIFCLRELCQIKLIPDSN
jgi:hypothetical protein